MTPLRPDILAAVIAKPDDDLPRLIAADWWEENGQGERAEFVRVQIELAIITPKPQTHELLFNGSIRSADWVDCECRYCALRLRERELVANADDGREWRDFGSFHPYAQTVKFVRGFVEEVTMTAAQWLRHRDAIRAATPIRKLVVSDRINMPYESPTGASQFQSLVQMQPMSLHELNELRPFANNPGLMKIWTLDVRRWQISDSPIENRYEERYYDGDVWVVGVGTVYLPPQPVGIINHPSHRGVQPRNWPGRGQQLR